MASKDKQVTESSIFCPKVKKVFNSFDVQINGKRPGDMQIYNDRVYWLLAKYTIGIDRLGLGEAYMDGDWDSDDLFVFFEEAFQSKVVFRKSERVISKMVHSLPLLTLNMQSKKRSKKDISHHYDIGNDLFKLMLDRSMNYSCGYWEKNAYLNPTESDLNVQTNTLCRTVDEAQMNKMFLIARKLKLEPGMKVLDIGCGWGYLGKFLAINFGVHVLGITISKEQIDNATSTDLESHELEFLRNPNMKCDGTGTFEFKLQDYRDTKETYDRIVSVGMLEHVGKKNYDEYFRICHKCLKDDGLVLIQSIGIAHDYMPQIEPWCNKYIFPGGMAPYPDQLISATFGRFIIEDWHSMGYNYYRTLIAWLDNFTESWPQLEDKYGLKFKRMWQFFLISSAVLFKTRKLNHWQIVLSKDGFAPCAGGYVSVR